MSLQINLPRLIRNWSSPEPFVRDCIGVYLSIHLINRIAEKVLSPAHQNQYDLIKVMTGICVLGSCMPFTTQTVMLLTAASIVLSFFRSIPQGIQRLKKIEPHPARAQQLQEIRQALKGIENHHTIFGGIPQDEFRELLGQISDLNIFELTGWVCLKEFDQLLTYLRSYPKTVLYFSDLMKFSHHPSFSQFLSLIPSETILIGHSFGLPIAFQTFKRIKLSPLSKSNVLKSWLNGLSQTINSHRIVV